MRRSLSYVSAIVVLVCSVYSGRQPMATAQAVASPSGPRLVVFISDLHLGVGKVDGTNVWHRTEDFRWANELELFLHFVNQEGQGKTDLVIVGDFLELWQSLDVTCIGEGHRRKCRVTDCIQDDPDRGCLEVQALQRVKRILSQHTQVFDALGVFASTGDNRVVIIPGNHDAALLYSSVARATLAVIPAPEGRVQIAKDGYWLSADKRLMAEHGHQFDKANQFAQWPAPFIEANGRVYLRRPWGEQFVQEYYNQYEEQFPIIDNISEESLGVRLGIAAGGTLDTAEAFGGFFRFFLFQVSWDQFRNFLGEQGEPPQWDVQGIKYGEGVRFLVESIPANDPMRSVAEKAFLAGALTIAPANLTDAEIETLCDQRAAWATLLNKPGQELITECPQARGTLGAVSNYFLRTPDGLLKDYLKHTYETLRNAHSDMVPFDTFIYGHTHKAVSGFHPIKESWNPTVVNTGAFQRVITPDQMQQLQVRKRLSDAEVLLRLQPEDLPACYSYIRIDPYSDKPKPLLRYWVLNERGKWGEQRQCE